MTNIFSYERDCKSPRRYYHPLPFRRPSTQIWSVGFSWDIQNPVAEKDLPPNMLVCERPSQEVRYCEHGIFQPGIVIFGLYCSTVTLPSAIACKETIMCFPPHASTITYSPHFIHERLGDQWSADRSTKTQHFAVDGNPLRRPHCNPVNEKTTAQKINRWSPNVRETEKVA